MQDRSYILENGTAVLEDGLLEHSTIVVRDGRIERIVSAREPQSSVPADRSLRRIDASGLYVAPGFVELHIHGCGNSSFESVDFAGFLEMEQFLVERGISVFLPTLQASESAIERMGGILDQYRKRQPEHGSRVPGLYIEGPGINPAKRGGILPECISAFGTEQLRRLIALSGNAIRCMTIAPELSGAPQWAVSLIEAGIVPCLGHSDCTVEAAGALLRNVRDGFTGGTFSTAGPATHRASNDTQPLPALNITHLFNAMSPISHKTPGLSALPFLDREIFFELNGDGVHIHPDILRLCYNSLNHEKLILISDAVITAGYRPEEAAGKTVRYFGKNVVSDQRGVRYRDSGVLIGSNRLLPDIVPFFMSVTGAGLHEAFRFASLNPARLLGIDERKGSLQPGKDADIILLDQDLKVVAIPDG